MTLKRYKIGDKVRAGPHGVGVIKDVASLGPRLADTYYIVKIGDGELWRGLDEVQAS